MAKIYRVRPAQSDINPMWICVLGSTAWRTVIEHPMARCVRVAEGEIRQRWPLVGHSDTWRRRHRDEVEDEHDGEQWTETTPDTHE